jgi:hypothetical protein
MSDEPRDQSQDQTVEDLEVPGKDADELKGGLKADSNEVAVEGIVSPRDPASGLPTGKR